jgi:hypothetical protein
MSTHIRMLRAVLFFGRMLYSSGKVCRAKKPVSVFVRLWLIMVTAFWLSPFALACDS